MNDPGIMDAAADGGKELNQLRRGPVERRNCSLFDLTQDFFDLCRLAYSGTTVPLPSTAGEFNEVRILDDGVLNGEHKLDTIKPLINRWSCNTCKTEFESLQDQRSHFKSDIHRFNVKLSISGKDIVNEEEFGKQISDSLLNDYDIASISGSDDETNSMTSGLCMGIKNKLFILHVRTGERFSIWKCLVMNEYEDVSVENKLSVVCEKEVIERLKFLVREPRNSTCLRIVLLASGGHFAGCVFDGNLIVTHKTFHRYVIRSKAGRKQSTKDASGKGAAHSAGASLRRYNELALGKEIRELLDDWNPYFLVSCCIFIYAPSNNRKLLFNREKPYFSCEQRVIRKIPLTVQQPTFKEAQRLYGLLTQINHEMVEECFAINKADSSSEVNKETHSCPFPTPHSVVEDESKSVVEDESNSTPLHEAAKSGNAEKVLELLEQGFDPCIKDGRGWTPYMLASVKEVRNVFRWFMSSNPEKWDWLAAKVPSPLTIEMEESQAEKDCKRKAREKELKKLRKARRKAEANQSQTSNEAPLSKEDETAAADDGRMMVAAASAIILTLVVGLFRRAIRSKMS